MEARNKNGEIALTSLELLYEVGREFAAALDLRTVLHRVLFLSMKYVGAVSGSIIVLDSNSQPVESAFLIHGRPTDHTTLQLRVTYERGLAGWVARNRQAVLVPDTSKDKRWLRLPDDEEERTGSKSVVSVPILAREDLVGVITLVHPRPGFFMPDHLELVTAIADQAGIFIQNARLFSESQRQAEVMTAVAESAAVITATLKLDEVLQRILEQISRALQARGTTLALLDPAGKELELRASTLKDSQEMLGRRIPLGNGIMGQVASAGQGVVILDAIKDPSYLASLDERPGFSNYASLCVPILSENLVTGVVEAINPLDRAFDRDDLVILSGIASMAGTAIRHAQLFESLQAAHRRYQELFEDSIDPIMITDWQGNILEANRQAVSTIGLDSDDLRSLTIGDLHNIHHEKIGPNFEKLVSGEKVSYESVLYSQMGHEIPVQVYASSIHYEGITHVQWILRDISERKDLDKLKEDLTAMVYHDLRSPLSNIVSSLEVLNTVLSGENDPTIQSLLSIATRSSDRIQQLTNTLLDINRLEAGQVIGNRYPIPPLALAQESVEMILPAARNKELEITVAVPSDLPKITVDVDMIRRVLINLLENAIKFTPPGGKIVIGAKQEDKSVFMWVKDSGPGISPTDQERIFEKFTRLNIKEGMKGLGLGLAYCRLAVAGHNGRIWVESKAGAGSRFIFTIPIVESPDD